MRKSVAAPLDEPPAEQPPSVEPGSFVCGSGFGLGFEPEPGFEPLPGFEPEPLPAGGGGSAEVGVCAIGITVRYADSLIAGCMMSDVS